MYRTVETVDMGGQIFTHKARATSETSNFVLLNWNEQEDHSRGRKDWTVTHVATGIDCGAVKCHRDGMRILKSLDQRADDLPETTFVFNQQPERVWIDALYKVLLDLATQEYVSLFGRVWVPKP